MHRTLLSWRLSRALAAGAWVLASALAPSAALAQPSVVISQAYGGGGQNANQPNVDYVELFNRGSQPQSLAGWSLQVSRGSDGAAWTVIPLSGVISPGQYFLVQVYSPASATGTAIPTPDVVGPGSDATLLFSGDGRAALVSSTTALVNPPCPAGTAGVADFLAWGAIYTCAEGGTSAPATTVATATHRMNGGCTDSNVNSADFSSAAPNPRNRRNNAFLTVSATPNDFPQQEREVTLLVQRSTLLPCNGQFGTIQAATADLTALGGPGAEPLLDDGGDDGAAGDGVWGVSVSVAATLPVGEYLVPITAWDGQLNLTSVARITVRPGVPGNDACGTPVELGSLAAPAMFTVDTSAATSDVDVGTCNTGTLTQFGVWYTFTAPASGALFMRETGAQDAVFGVFTGPCDMLAPVTPTSCFATDDPSVLTVTAGTTYRILVGNQSSSTTPPTAPLNLVFSFSPRPVNDDCGGAIDLGNLATPLSTIIDNAGATDDLDVTCNSGSVTRFGVWYTFTAPTSGALLLSETGTQDIVYGVFTGDCAAPAPLAPTSCFAQDNGTLVPVSAGTRYLLLLGNQGSTATVPTAPFSMTFTFAPTPANDACASARAVTTFPFSDTPFAPNATDDLDVTCNAATNTLTRKGVWYEVTTGLDSGRLIPSESSGNDVVFALFTGESCEAHTPAGCLNESGAAAGFVLGAGQTYRLLVGLNSATINPTLPYAIGLSFAPDTGACCTAEGCQLLSASTCAAASGVFRGPNTPCQDVPRYINTASAAIPDYVGPAPAPSQPLVSVIDVPASDTGTVTTLAVRVALSHTAGGDLTIRLTGPSGAGVDLIKRAGLPDPCALGLSGSSNDLGGVYIIADVGATTWAAGLAGGGAVLPAGTYRPSGCGDAAASLNTAFAGSPIAGQWTLSVADEDEGLTGSLTSWGLIINGADAACPSGACCVGLVCSIGSAAECTRRGGTLTAGVACSPQTCVPTTGACCNGSTCSITTEAACTGFATGFAGVNTVCNVFGVNNNAPCCLADYNHVGGVTVEDIFDFLFAYFSAQPGADVNGSGSVTVQDIFDYLFLYFAGPC